MVNQASEQSIFLHAIGLPSPEERSAYLDQACGVDKGLRSELDALLAAHDRLGGRLPSTGGEQAPSEVATVTQSAKAAGTVLAGRYKLLEEIGEGGMGTVWMAEQMQPVKRLVAVKLIKAGMDSRTVLARFEAERQALALMDHPNIAKVLDAGSAPDGRPYFVMELVKGVPITRFCDERRLTPRRRLELFASVCQAVQHAHQKGVIHRDIKPSNVLVALYDDRPVPKVIDFGVAKATGQPLTERTLHTGFGSVVGTLEYMSPEQASFNQLDVDTRSDVYSLGVLLYELLTGSPPFSRQEYQKAGVLEMLRLIREQEPTKPSTKLSTAEGLPTLAANRGTEPRRLTRLVRGELDWIVMKALEKDRNRRYETANGFALDVRRYLADDPVLACPPSAGYRLRKFLRRHKGPVLAACLVVLALVGGVMGTAWQALKTEQARRDEAERAEGEKRAKETAQKRLAQIEKGNALLGSVFANLDPKAEVKEGKGLRVLLGERLEVAAKQLDGDAVGDPLVVAQLQRTLGVSLLGLGYPEKAIDLFTKVRAACTSHLGPDHPDTVTSMNYLAMGYLKAGKQDLALPLWEEALKLGKPKLGLDHPDTLACMNNLAMGYRDAGNLGLALPLLEEALRGLKARHGPDHPDTLACMSNLASGYKAAGKVDLALPLLEETLELLKGKLGPDHPKTLTSMNNLATGYVAAGKVDLALPLFQQAAAGVEKRKFVHEHAERIVANLIVVHERRKQFDQAEAWRRKGLAVVQGRWGAGSAAHAGALAGLGVNLLAQKKFADAEPILRECLVIRSKTTPDEWTTFSTKSLLGAALLGQNKYADAEPLLLAGFEGLKQREGKMSKETRPRLTEALERLVQLYEAWEKNDQADEWRKKLERLKKGPGR